MKKKKDVKQRVVEFLDSLAEDGYSAHIVVAKDRNLEACGGVGDLEDIAHGYVGLFSDASSGKTSNGHKATCLVIADVVSKFQTFGMERLLMMEEVDDNVAVIDADYFDIGLN